MGGKSAPSPCKECSKANEYTLPIPNCQERIHSLCAYLSGYPMQTEGKAVAITSDNPCPQLALQRKFRLNFEKLLSRQGEDFQLLANYL